MYCCSGLNGIQFWIKLLFDMNLNSTGYPLVFLRFKHSFNGIISSQFEKKVQPRDFIWRFNSLLNNRVSEPIKSSTVVFENFIVNILKYDRSMSQKLNAFEYALNFLSFCQKKLIGSLLSSQSKSTKKIPFIISFKKVTSLYKCFIFTHFFFSILIIFIISDKVLVYSYLLYNNF